jgi:membrane protein
VGLAIIVYAAIGLMVTIENSFNIIYRAPGGRRWTRRVPLYWFLLTVSPVLVGVASYLNNQFTGWIASVDTWQWLLFTVRSLWSFALAWLFMFAVYALVPNSTVAARPALAGALVAAVLLGIGKHTLGAYLGNAFSINQLYGSLGLVPLFMFWVYVMWLAVLFGLQVSATLQMLHGRSLDEMNHPHAGVGMVDPASVLTVMQAIGEHFVAGQPVTPRQLADVTAIPELTIARMIERLIEKEWLHRVERPETAVSLAKPPEQMEAKELLEIGFGMLDEVGQRRCSILVKQLRDAQQTVLDGMTLAALLSAAPEPSAATREPS